uniref:Uncharacterized protein n=1 Tax=Hucho hucho TaxID=62062 RepID=A0A4W5KUR3_9TELE
ILDATLDEEIEDLKKRSLPKAPSKAEWLSTKLHALLWVGGACLLAYYLDVALLQHRRRLRRCKWLHHGVPGALAAVCTQGGLGVECVLSTHDPHCDHRRSRRRTWVCARSTWHPTRCDCSLILGLWPVWGLFTPGILFVLFLGTLMTAHFLPAM